MTAEVLHTKALNSWLYVTIKISREMRYKTVENYMVGCKQTWNQKHYGIINAGAPLMGKTLACPVIDFGGSQDKTGHEQMR